MGANRGTRSFRRPLLGACVRRDKKEEASERSPGRAPKLRKYSVDVSGLETSCKKARAWPSKLPPQGYTHRQLVSSAYSISARPPTCEARKVREENLF